MFSLLETHQLCQALCHICFVSVAVTEQHVLVHAAVLLARCSEMVGKLLTNRCQSWHHSPDSCLCFQVHAIEQPLQRLQKLTAMS